MKILAVIPARAASKGIPNKNIRIINGRPMVHYAISNALQSRYITDIVVTTDSPEVCVIATQMGVPVRWREAALCTDATTLDAVIADAACIDTSWNYVITMQPTSPTLQVETLDAAIAYAIEKDYDTLISVVNRAHLSWGIQDGALVPLYAARLNRQYLPPYYMETGAFLISKAEVVTPQSRIGPKVGVYEVSQDEAVDVDSFEDLQSVVSILGRPRVAIYVNGNKQRGVGHIYRALELADCFFVKPDIYYDLNQTQEQVFGNTTHQLIAVNGIAELFEQCREKKYTIFINDILATSIDYMIGLRSVLPEAKIINFEDDGEGALKADVVFNALYEKQTLPHVYAGEAYYIANRTFLYYMPIEIRDHVHRVFISFGGADPQDYSDRLLRMITRPAYREIQFLVVLGRAKDNVAALLEYGRYDNIEVYHDIVNMPELMSRCDIGIASRGRTSYELAMLGIPTMTLAQNPREEKHGFVCVENGFFYLGLNPDDAMIEENLKMMIALSKKSRQRLQTLLLSHDLRGGRNRVMSVITALQQG